MEPEDDGGNGSKFNVAAFVICVVIILIAVGVTIFLCRRRQHMKRMAELHNEEQSEVYIPSDAP